MRLRSALVILAALLFLPVLAPGASAHDGQVSLAFGDLEVTQSMQTRPQVPAAAGIGLSAHKPTVIRAYIQAQRYLHISLFGFTLHLPVFTPVSVNGTLTVRQGATVLATLPASNGPISVVPWSTPNPENANSSLSFAYGFPPNGTLSFELDLTSGTSGVVAVDPPATSRDFFHNRRLRVEGVRLQYDNDPARIADAGMAANGVQWFLKSGPLAPCKLQYWVNPTVLQWPTDLSLTIDGTLLTTLAGMQVQGSTTYDNVFGWWSGSVSGNGLGQNPSCASPHAVAAYGNTDPARYQRTFTHELYHNYCQVHQSQATGQIGVTGFDTDLFAPVSSTRYDVMVPGLLTAQAWQSPSRYTTFWNLWQDTGTESFFDACHFNWWQVIPKGVFMPYGPLNPIEVELKPINVIFVNGIVNPETLGFLWPSWRVTRTIEPTAPSKEGKYAVQLIGANGAIVGEQRFDASFQGDGEEVTPYAFSFVLPTPVDPETGGLDLQEVRLVQGDRIMDRAPVSLLLPAVQITGPDPTQMPRLDKPFRLDWTASDDDSPELYFAVQYSPDGGQHFIGTAGNMENASSLMLDPANLPGSDNGLFRVLVSDGLNTSEATVGPFVIPRKGPHVDILGPDPKGQERLVVIAEGTPVLLEGYGTSPDDGVLPGDMLEWSSDLQGPLGTGYVLSANLKTGRHTITLTGIDRFGAKGVTQLTIDVNIITRDTDGDGTPDVTDLCPTIPGPPENDGCPYLPGQLPLGVKVTVVDPKGVPTQGFDSFFDVFFQIDLSNPRPTDVSLQSLRATLTLPDGTVQTQDLGFVTLVPAGATLSSVFGLSTLVPTKNPSSGPYAGVFEPIAGLNQALGRAAGGLVFDPNLRTICNGPAFGEPGTRVSVPIVLDNGDGVAGFQEDVDFDPAVLTPVAIRPGADTSAGGWTFNMAPIGPGLLRALGSSNPPAGLGPGPREVAIIDFNIAASAPSGPTHLSDGNCVLSDPAGQSIPCQGCPQPPVVIVRNASSYTFEPIPSPVGVDRFDPLPFPVKVEAFDSLGNPAAAYSAVASIDAGPLCPGTLQPGTLSFVSGMGSGIYTLNCCLDPLLPATATTLSLTASDPPIQVSGTSGPFQGVAKADVDASGGVNVLDVTRAIRQALMQSVPTPPPVAFQFWASNMLDQICAVDGGINVLDVVRIRNKALGRPPLCPCTATGAATVLAATPGPISITLERQGPRDYLLMVHGAVDLGGLQFDLRGVAPGTRLALAGLTAGQSWQVTTEAGQGATLRVVAISNTAAGVSGDGAVLRITGAGSPRIEGIVASDSEGRAIPVR